MYKFKVDFDFDFVHVFGCFARNSGDVYLNICCLTRCDPIYTVSRFRYRTGYKVYPDKTGVAYFAAFIRARPCTISFSV